jgi:AhpD family alkylhydroperoxidase
MPRIPVTPSTALRRQPGPTEGTGSQVRQGPEHPRRDVALAGRAPVLRRAAVGHRRLRIFRGPHPGAIALAVGNADDCSYCQAAHTGGGKAAGLTDDEMVAIPRGAANLDPELATLLALAREYAKEGGSVQDYTWQSALDAGRTEEQLTELSVHVTLNLLTNHFNHFVQTELDLPAAPAI